MTDADRHPRIRVAAIITQGASVLMVQHLKGGRKNWLLPGGGVQYGESLDEALRRELHEEARLGIRVGPLAYVVESLAPDRTRHVVNLCFLAEADGAAPRLGNDPRVVDVRFVQREELESLRMHPDVRSELCRDLTGGFPTAAYLGVRWAE